MVPNASHDLSDNSPLYVTYYDRDGSKNLTMIVVHALAELMDADVTDVEKELYRSVNPEALDHLFKRQYNGAPRDNGHVTLLVNGYLVMVSSDGRIEITPRYALDHE